VEGGTQSRKRKDFLTHTIRRGQLLLVENWLHVYILGGEGESQFQQRRLGQTCDTGRPSHQGREVRKVKKQASKLWGLGDASLGGVFLGGGEKGGAGPGL